MQELIIRQPDVIYSCDDYAKYIAYDVENGSLKYWYEFKGEQYNQIIKEYFPRDLIYQVMQTKENYPIVITKMRFCTPLLQIMHKETQSVSKISDQLRKSWLQQLLQQFEQYHPINPRLDFVMIDTRSGELFFDIAAFIPRSLQYYQEKLEKMVKLQEIIGREQLMSQLYFFQMLQYNHPQFSALNFQQEDEMDEGVSCQWCKQMVGLIKFMLNPKDQSDLVIAANLKKLIDQMKQNQHVLTKCQFQKQIQQFNCDFDPDVFSQPVVKLAYCYFSIKDSNPYTIQNLIIICRILKLKISKQMIGLSPDFFNFSASTDDFIKKYKSNTNSNVPTAQQISPQMSQQANPQIKISYRNAREETQILVIQKGNTEVTTAIIDEPLEELAKSVCENTKNFVEEKTLLQLFKQSPPKWK